jgi:hypothetical protein
MENKEENTTVVNKENNQEIHKEINDYSLTKKVGWIIGTYFIGFTPMVFLYGLFNMYVSPSLKYMNIMLSSIVFYYFGFIELGILVVSLGLLYLNNNYDLIKNKISKIIFFYNSLKKAKKIDTSNNPEFEIINSIINKINKYEILLNKFVSYFNKKPKPQLGSFKVFIPYAYFMYYTHIYINKLEYLLNDIYQKIRNMMTSKIKDSQYITKTIEPVINVINDVIQDKKDIEMQDEYINTKKTFDMIKNDIDKNDYNTKETVDIINDDITDNKSILDDEHIYTEDEITNKFQHMEKELEQFDNLINELNKLDMDNDKSQSNMTEEEMIKSLDLINLFSKMMKITELEPDDKKKCKDKIKNEIMDTPEFMNLLNNSFS